MTFEGTLRRVDLGTGVWVLETGDGERLTLYGDVPPDLDGHSVKVKGRAIEAMGIAMVGDRAVKVSSVRAR